MKYLIASHGEYAAGLASAVRRLAGENPDVTALCAYTDEVPLETHMQNIMAGHETETWIIMTDLLGGMLVILLLQVLVMALYNYFFVFRILGKNYDAAVMCSGLCGHGLGATPTAIVNMTAVCEKYGMSRRAFMIVPIVGAFLVDIIYQPQTIAFIKFFVQGYPG